MVLGFSEMMEEDRPDEAIWLDEPQLMEHFDNLRIKRQESRNRDQAGSDDEGWSSTGEMESNQYADDLLREVGAA